MIYEVDLFGSYDFENWLLASDYSLQIIEIPSLIVFSMNWYFSISQISFKLIWVNLSLASQLLPAVHKWWARSNPKEFMDSFLKVSNTQANNKTSTLSTNHDSLSEYTF